MYVRKVQPSKASSCRSRGLIDEVIWVHSMLHIYPSINTGTRDRQFNVSERHPAGILLTKVFGKFWVLRPGIEPRTSSVSIVFHYQFSFNSGPNDGTESVISVSLFSYLSNRVWRLRPDLIFTGNLGLHEIIASSFVSLFELKDHKNSITSRIKQ